jgi:hypothetical protein
MFGVFFSILITAALVGAVGELTMRVRLSRRAPDKMAWWRSGGDEVAAAYEQLFPDSFLPRYRRVLFWIVMALASLVLGSILWKSR